MGFLVEIQAPSGREVRRAFESLLDQRILRIVDVHLVSVPLDRNHFDVGLLAMVLPDDPLFTAFRLERDGGYRQSVD